MAYQLPLRFIKVSNDVSVCATRIVAMMSTELNQARRTIKDEKRAGTLINAAGRTAVKTAIFLDNGTVIASPLTISRLMTAIEKSNQKQPHPSRINNTARMRVYDVSEEESDDDTDMTDEDNSEEVLEEDGVSK